MKHTIALKLIVLLFAFWGMKSAKAIQSETCYASFTEFAYNAPLLNRDLMAEVLLPQWSIVSVIPPSPEPAFPGLSFIAAQRTIQGRTEIWIRHGLPHSASQSSLDFAIYTPELGNWHTVSSQVADSGVSVTELFVSSDHRIWGKTDWSNWNTGPLPVSLPVMALFNEETNRFEFARGVPVIAVDQTSNTDNYSEIIYGGSNFFWIFNLDSQIYRYDLFQYEAEAVGALASFVTDTTRGTDGMIFLEIFSSPLTEPPYRVRDDTLLRLDPDNLALDAVTVPTEVTSWPIYNGLLTDHANNLWLGSTGYRTAMGDWVLVHDDPHAFLELVDSGGFSYLWQPAQLIYQTSDGRLWFNRFLDTGGWGEGLAWYDPESDMGCLITNQYTNLVEDDDGDIWLATGGFLYIYSLTP